MITVSQRPFGREFDSSGGRVGYLVVCTNGETEEQVEAAVEAEAPASQRGMPLSDIRAEEVNVDADGEPSMWDVEVRYGGGRIAIFPQTGNIIWSGTTAGGTQRITHGLKFREAITPVVGQYVRRGASFDAYHKPSVNVPDTWGAIGATKDGVAGADIVVPVDSFNAVKYVDAAEWPALRENIKLITGTINNAPWVADGEPFAKGEVLFLGATWAKRTEVEPNDYEVSFGFSAGHHLEDLVIGKIGKDEPPQIKKDAWDLLDVNFENTESEHMLVQEPLVATVHRIYRSANFGVLGLD